MQRRRRFDDLPPDVLREIAGRLHVAADFVRFHAVCKPWRNSRDMLSGTTATTKQFLPWLLPSAGEHHVPLKMRCVFAKSSYRASSPPPLRWSWVASADGDALRYLTVHIIQPRLHDPLTGAVTDLPPFPPTHYLDGNWGENPCGIIYRDGTVLLNTISIVFANGRKNRFRVALLRPGETRWTFIDRTMQSTSRPGEFCAIYHGAKIFVTAETSLWRIITPDGGCDTLVPMPWMMGQKYNYVLESDGELLWASVQVRWSLACRYPAGSHYVCTLSVLVHTLEEASTPGKMRWIRKDGRSLADRVLFLGSPTSFAVQASLLGCHGGCAYFVHHNSSALTSGPEVFGVFRYNLVDGKTECIERLPPEWNTEKCTWLIPQPTIAPIQEINERNLEGPKLKQQHQKTVSVTSPTHDSR